MTRACAAATSILAAIGLLNRAYEVIANHPDTKARIKTEAIQVLSRAVGTDGLIAGQEIDLHERKSFNEISPIEGLNWLKTGALFVAAAEIGALAAGLESHAVDAVKRFARHVGLAFQTADDLIDEQGDIQTAGKDVGQDRHKPTLVTIAGAQAARLSCEEHLQHAREALKQSGLESAELRGFVDSIFGREMNS